MRKLFSILLFSVIVVTTQAQSKIIGTWYNIDDEDGKPKSQISIYENNSKLEGKVIKLLEGATITHCNACSGTNKNKAIEGMKILWGLKKSSDKFYNEGEILDPKTGKVYDAYVELVSQDKLKVRGYIGVSALGRTQYWYRVK